MIRERKTGILDRDSAAGSRAPIRRSLPVGVWQSQEKPQTRTQGPCMPGSSSLRSTSCSCLHSSAAFFSRRCPVSTNACAQTVVHISIPGNPTGEQCSDECPHVHTGKCTGRPRAADYARALPWNGQRVCFLAILHIESEDTTRCPETDGRGSFFVPADIDASLMSIVTTQEIEP